MEIKEINSQVPNLFRRFRNTKVDSQFSWFPSWGAWSWPLVGHNMALGCSFNVRRHRLGSLRGRWRRWWTFLWSHSGGFRRPWLVSLKWCGLRTLGLLILKILFVCNSFFCNLQRYELIVHSTWHSSSQGHGRRIWRIVVGIPRNWHWWSPWHWAKEMRRWRHHISSRLGKDRRDSSRWYRRRIICKYWWRQRKIHTQGAQLL